MKKLLLTLSLIGLFGGAYAQGLINLSNGSNTSTDRNAATGGLFWLDPDGFACPLGPIPINTDFNVNFYGGSDSNNLILLKTFVNSGNGAAFGAGTFVDLSGKPVAIEGALTTGFFRIEAWWGSPTFSGAGQYANWSTYLTVFSNPLGPPGLATDFTAMPAIVIGIPEPSTIALAGLGAAALLSLRPRR